MSSRSTSKNKAAHSQFQELLAILALFSAPLLCDLNRYCVLRADMYLHCSVAVRQSATVL